MLSPSGRPAAGLAAPLLDRRIARKLYGDRTVLADIALQVAPREIVCVVGPSGCGKSTLLRIVAGLDANFRGSVTLDGSALAGPSARVGVIFQEPRLLPWLSIADNVGFAAGARGGRDPSVARLLDEVGLAGVARQLPATLSGGMAQRAVIARGLFGEPDLLLLDEPFSAVDAITRMRLQTLLLDVVQRRRMAATVVTHDLDEALYLGDRVLMLAPNPDRVDDELHVDIARPRDRRDPSLAALRARLLDAFQRFHDRAAGDTAATPD
ncbi:MULTISPECIES: ABC transporter ATP-binding protein [Burkholderia]|uniref:ABC transporter ATP-binding protein n=1 Tax=Burkholderia TaxID=32008 RepID=UPI000751B42E|nr:MULTISPECIES: ABC transporter ATP-binding protein [Burkholderia]KVN57611.1 sulfonate ABC transporter ATP-binding protein [Burkholderia anthina]MDF3090382.1 ABC transporter ATP-binding protein [Burkholderia semiarida]MDF3102528.1 ABC transporter ATP-binding protein [Burkholderia semiarida]